MATENASSEDELAELLRQFQRLIVRYPFAAQALYSGLVAEGRRYVSTPEGQEWARRLAGSDLLRRGRAVWDVTTLNVLEEDPNAIVPSKLLEAFVQMSSKASLEQTLQSLFAEVIAPRGGSS